MSDFMSIAAVTETLRYILDKAIHEDLNDRLTLPDASTAATALRPIPNLSQNSNLPKIGVNIYLYSVSFNSSWRNADLPTRRSEGSLLKRPRAALDLHYLLTFYGDDSKLEPQLVLGSVVRILHSQPLLTRKQIQDHQTDHVIDAVSLTDLAEEIEQIKLTPMGLSLEDLSKLWSVFFQTPYNLSIAYQASVIFIEGTEKSTKALPVREPRLYLDLFRNPVIDQVVSLEKPGGSIIAGDTLVIKGRQLRGDITLLRFSGTEVVVEDVRDTEIKLMLSSPPFPSETLRAGVQGVQVVHDRRMGKSQVSHSGFESNAAAFVLCPTIQKSSSGYEIFISPDPTNLNPQANKPLGWTITVKVSPGVGGDQKAVLMLNKLGATSPIQAYTFGSMPINPPQGHTETDTISFHAIGLEAGDYLIRVQIDGAESPLYMGSDPKDPIYAEPKVTIQ
ncbi:MAG: DUF4255 domain-containing protein [Methanotrichaceae archaeon]